MTIWHGLTCCCRATSEAPYLGEIEIASGPLLLLHLKTSGISIIRRDEIYAFARGMHRVNFSNHHFSPRSLCMQYGHHKIIVPLMLPCLALDSSPFARSPSFIESPLPICARETSHKKKEEKDRT
jgi:hypothetical protein